MNYLLYLKEGFIKKFPLSQNSLLLGRDKTCDLRIDDPSISREHARITCFEDRIIIDDLNSKNGLFVGNIKVSKIQIGVNESFRIGYIEFFLKSGNSEEIKIPQEIQPVVDKISDIITSTYHETVVSLNIFEKSLVAILRYGFQIVHFDEILLLARIPLSNILHSGQIQILNWGKDQFRSHARLDLSLEKEDEVDLQDLNLSNKDKEIIGKPIPGSNTSLYFFPFHSSDKPASLLYTASNDHLLLMETLQFLRDFTMELSLIYNLLKINGSEIRDIEKPGSAEEIIYRNKSMENLLSRCHKIASADLYVLLEGEAGIGKETIAHYIHQHSPRNGNPCLVVHCSAIQENRLEDDLFGHERGAIPGSASRKTGKLEEAANGTLVLDEIGELPLNLQGKIWRTLKEKEYSRIGGDEKIKLSCRIISLTSKNLLDMIRVKLFREDLYYLLAHFKLNIPPLRDRPEDIQLLIDHFKEKFCRENHIYIRGFSNLAIEALNKYPWPGNIRELKNEINSLVSQSFNGDTIQMDLLKPEIQDHYQNLDGEKMDTEDIERDELLEILKQYRWNKTRVAEALNISRSALYKKLKNLDIE